MDESSVQKVRSGLSKWRNGVPKWLKQTSIMLTIMGLTALTEASSSVIKIHYIFQGLFCVPGFLLMLIFTEYLGRKRLFMALFTLSIISSLLFLGGQEFISLIILAPVYGASAAMTSIVMYEYCDPKNRIVFLITNAFVLKLTSWATLACHEKFDNFRLYMHYFVVGLGLIFLGLVFTWPESPYWLASKRKYDECRQAFLSIRSEKSQLSGELETMTKGPRCGSFKMVFFPILMAFLMLIMKSTLQHIENALFEEIKTDSLNVHDEYGFYLILNCIALFLIVSCIFIALKIPRREMFLLSSTSVNVISFSLLDAAGPGLRDDLRFVLVLNLIVMCISTAIAFPIIIETIPQKYVNLLITIISSMFIIIQFIDSTTDILYVFMSYPMMNTFVFIFSVVIYYVMPETKDKTLLEIEQSYLPERKQLLPQNQTVI